jgi:hypothetical protein
MMRTPDEVAAMLRLKALGWGVRRIAAAFGCSHMTVRRYLGGSGWTAYRTPRRRKALDGLEDWLAERSKLVDKDGTPARPLLPASTSCKRSQACSQVDQRTYMILKTFDKMRT